MSVPKDSSTQLSISLLTLLDLSLSHSAWIYLACPVQISHEKTP